MKWSNKIDDIRSKNCFRSYFNFLLYLTFNRSSLEKVFKNGETYKDVQKRIYEVFTELEKKYKGKAIVLVSHQAPLWLLENKVKGISIKEAMESQPRDKRITRGELRELNTKHGI